MQDICRPIRAHPSNVRALFRRPGSSAGPISGYSRRSTCAGRRIHADQAEDASCARRQRAARPAPSVAWQRKIRAGTGRFNSSLIVVSIAVTISLTAWLIVAGASRRAPARPSHRPGCQPGRTEGRAQPWSTAPCSAGARPCARRNGGPAAVGPRRGPGEQRVDPSDHGVAVRPLPNSALVSACVKSSATTASAHGPERAPIGRTKHSSRCGRFIVHSSRPPRISQGRASGNSRNLYWCLPRSSAADRGRA